MLFTLATTRYPATDLGYLLHKHPAKVQSVSIKNGQAHIFYTEAAENSCTCALLLDIDPVSLVRGNEGFNQDSFALEQYVNDRPYASSSFMSTAIAKAYSSALNGKCKDRPELVHEALPLTATLSVVPVRGGQELLESLFLPLGYQLQVVQHPLDEQFPDWGNSRYFSVTLTHTITLQELLLHLFILIPVLDNDKHYWVGEEEVQKLLDKGKGWLDKHPQRDLIVRRYLKNQKALMHEALSAFTKPEPDTEDMTDTRPMPKEPRLHDVRLQTVCSTLLKHGIQTVTDMGCGEGKLLRLLLEQPQFTAITGVDVSAHSLNVAADRLKLGKMGELQKKRIRLLQGSATFRDKRLEGAEALVMVEVIEHLEPHSLQAMQLNVFGVLKPALVIITTPNKEWNSTFTEDEAKMRHSDHRFEWTRMEFDNWCSQVCTTYAYEAEILPVGEVTREWGAPGQMAVFYQTIKEDTL